MHSTINDFEIIKQLGQGSYGNVYLVKRIKDQNFYCIKEIVLQEQYVENQINECKLLASIHSDFVIKYYDSFIDKNKLNICMEYASQGTLRNFILKTKNINERLAYQIITQMAIGLGELHVNNIIHRDYKSMNIFINQNLFKIGDLGVSKQIQEQNFLCQTITGSPYYLAPELCKGEPYTYAVDIYAFGVTIYELLNQGHHPFEASNQAALLVNILKGKYPHLSLQYSKQLQQLVYSCLNQQPTKRPTIYQILQDKIIQQIIKENKFILSQKLQQKLQQSQDNKQIQESSKFIDLKQNQNKIDEVESEQIQLKINQDDDSDDFDDDDDQYSTSTQQTVQQVENMNKLLQEDKILFQEFEQILKKIKQFQLTKRCQNQILQYYEFNAKPVFQDISGILQFENNIKISNQKLQELEKYLIQYGKIQNQRKKIQKQMNQLL